MSDLLKTKPESGFTFDRVPTPLEPENRPIWRISLIALILLQLGWGPTAKASSQKILALSSLVSSKHKRALLAPVLQQRAKASDLNIRFDPSVNRAIDFGLAEGLFELDKNKNICLTPNGREFAKKLKADKDVFEAEKQFIEQFSKQELNENAIHELITG